MQSALAAVATAGLRGLQLAAGNATTGPSTPEQEVPSLFTGIVSFPYLVLFWAAVLGVWTFYLLALSGSTLAGLACRLANALVLRRAGCELHLGSLSISLLGGRVFFSDLRYATRDVAVVVLRGEVVVRWWSPARKLRDGFHNPAGLPCRLEVSLAGLHVALLNRAWSYDEMEAAAKQASTAASAGGGGGGGRSVNECRDGIQRPLRQRCTAATTTTTDGQRGGGHQRAACWQPQGRCGLAGRQGGGAAPARLLLAPQRSQAALGGGQQWRRTRLLVADAAPRSVLFVHGGAQRRVAAAGEHGVERQGRRGLRHI